MQKVLVLVARHELRSQLEDVEVLRTHRCGRGTVELVGRGRLYFRSLLPSENFVPQQLLEFVFGPLGHLLDLDRFDRCLDELGASAGRQTLAPFDGEPLKVVQSIRVVLVP